MPSDESPDQPAANGGGARLPRSVYNWLSIVGTALALVGLTSMLANLVLGLLTSSESGYGGLALLPLLALTLLGVALFALGAVRERNRRRAGRGPSITGIWAIDTQRLKQDHVAIKFAAGTVGASLVVIAVGSLTLQSLHYAESNAFCGSVCHSVMQPEAAAYEHSPHARIDCVDCHVGEGAESFIRSKLNGINQVIDVITGDIDRPIPTPIRNRRPSREMCESCHWADRMIDYQIFSRDYHRADENNTPRGVRMMVKIGGGANGSGINRDGLTRGSGIHYHMLTAQKVEYIARDSQQQQIRWVRVTRDDGSITEYDHLEDPLQDGERETLELRTMECLDCHNRPAHRFRSPIDLVNEMLASGELSRDLPYLKREAVRALDGDYATTEAAMQGISESLWAFYRENYAALAAGGSSAIDENVSTLQAVYRENIFPEMKADWKAHPDNIGHRDSPGCFRCHNYELESEDGETVFVSCSTCHVILAQLEPTEAGSEMLRADFAEGAEFLHPDGDEYTTNQTVCSDCHNGGYKLYEKAEDGR